MTVTIRRRHKSLRLQGYDYSRHGAYFVTIMTKNRDALFGEVVAETMTLNDLGRAVQNIWENLPNHYQEITTDQYVVMPNHIHGIIWIENNLTNNQDVGVGLSKTTPGNDVAIMSSRPTLLMCHAANVQGAGLVQPTNEIVDGANKIPVVRRPAPTGSRDLSEIIRFFKSFSAKRVNALRNMSGAQVWQRGYHDRIIRTETELNQIRGYIQTNPLRWSLDQIQTR
jgi:putative transposase